MYGACDVEKAAMRRSPLFHLYSIFLFTRSDLKTIVFPQTVFAISAALSLQKDDLGIIASRLPQLILWIWLLLLVECIANQRLPDSIEEDAINKPWRALPSGRLLPEEALKILRVVIPVTAATAFTLGAFTPTVSFMVLVWMYNDLEGSDVGPISKNLLNAGGLASWGWGGIAVLSGGASALEAQTWNVLAKWILLTGAVVITTIHAQDLPDVKGDAARNRKTLPLLYGQAPTRWSLAVAVVFWSVVCPWFCNVQMLGVWGVVVALGSAMAGLTLCSWRERTDKIVWNLWCVWVAAVYTLPFFGKLAGY